MTDDHSLMKRRLAAILAADIAGYSRLMGEDEAATVRDLKGHQAVMETVYGETKLVNGKLAVVNVKRYPADQVNPPANMKAADWIKGGFKK